VMFQRVRRSRQKLFARGDQTVFQIDTSLTRRNYFVPGPRARFPAVSTQKAEGAKGARTRIGDVKTGASIPTSPAPGQKKAI
jgi:hypothetical protein